MGLKVALCGLWQETRKHVPWTDTSWEKWGLSWDKEWIFRFDRVFEMHQSKELEEIFPPEYFERLAMLPRLYLHEADARVPRAQVYPFEDVARTTGAYWASSIGYMLALAIHEGAEEIAIYGVAMEAGDEYGYQRPNAEYMAGFARGRGIKVHIPDESPLCKYRNQFGYSGRYGRVEEKA